MGGTPSDSFRVLHVDDEPDFVETAATFLERLDSRLEVESVTNASEALDRLQEDTVDCIVSDFDMPGQDGLEFLDAVREDDPDLPFILYTGKGSETVASEAIASGVTDYLQKETGTGQYKLLANRIVNAIERQRSREVAIETEQRLQTIAENTNDILWKFTDDWNELLFINSAYEDIWGRTIDELEEQPQSFLEGIHPDDRDFVRDAMGQLSSGDSVDIEYRVNADEDFSRWVWVQGEPVFDEDGAVDKVVGFARDITERKEREQRLERQNAQLDEFTSIISHDLRNPLSVAMGRVELAQEESNSEHLDAAATALERMRDIIDDVLELARTGAESTDTESVLISEIIDDNWRGSEPGGAKTVVTMDRPIQADRSQLDQLLENLIRNASEHSESDVTVTIGGLPDGFYVEDEGPGIPPEERDKIFDTGYSTKDQGTDFGLNVVQQVVDAHGWEIAVTEPEDGGARFEVTGVQMAE